MSHLGLLDDADHEAKYDTDEEYRKSELRIQALGAAISRRDWHAVETAYASIRDKFHSHAVDPHPSPIQQIAQAFEHGELPPMTGTDFLSDSPEEDLPPMSNPSSVSEELVMAKAMAERLHGWDHCCKAIQDTLLVDARAAIEAIAPRLKAEGLREAEGRARELAQLRNRPTSDPTALALEALAVELIARADALSPPYGQQAKGNDAKPEK